MIQVTSTAGLDVRYTYDGLGRRVSRSKLNAPTEERRYLYDEGSRLLAVYDGSGTLLQQFVYATGRHVPDLMIQSNTTVFHLLTDQVGSVRRVVSTAGSPAQQTDYDAWGRIKSDSVPGFQPFGFAGGLYDKDTGLVQMGARWYDPVVGRFVKKDPALFDGGFNLYAYTGDDPVNFFDRTGNGSEAFQESFNQFWRWFQPLPAPAKAGVIAAAANAFNVAAPYALTYGACIGAGMLMTGDTPRSDSEPLPWGAEDVANDNGKDICVNAGFDLETCVYVCPDGQVISQPHGVSLLARKPANKPANGNLCWDWIYRHAI